MPILQMTANGVVYVATDLAVCAVGCGHSALHVLAIGAARWWNCCRRSVTTYVVAELDLVLSPAYAAGAGYSRFEGHSALKRFRPYSTHHAYGEAPAATLGFSSSQVFTTHHDTRISCWSWRQGICVSAAVAEGMRRLHISDSKLRVVRNGPLGSPRRPEVGAAPSEVAINKPAIVTLALHSYKGVTTLLRHSAVARKSIPDASLYILGQGPAKP